MIKKINQKFLFFLLLFLSLILISAYIIEYMLGHVPCELCIYQRIPYFISVILIAKIIFFKKYEKITLLTLLIIFIGSLILAFYHFGIEQGFFSESFVCEAQNLDNNLSKEEVLKQLKENTVSCKDVTFKVFGLSLASINTIFSFVLLIIFIKLYKNYETN
mgnify:CR=1 FL=1